MNFFIEHFDPIKLMGHIAYALILFSFLVKRMLALRALAITASCCFIIYNMNVPGGPIVIPIQWNVLFILVNCYHITVALLDKRKIKLNDQEEFVYLKNFQSMTRMEFKRLMECGFTRSYSAHHRLINQNEAIEAIYVIMEGQSHVFANGFHVATLEKGEFIGEMSFLTNTPPRADVIVSQDSQIHFWSTEDLRSHFGKRPLMLGKFHSAIGNQVISKLVVKSLAEAK